MPTEVDIEDRDETATDAEAIIRRLNKVLSIQKKVTARLDLIRPNSPEPGPPDLPTLVNSIITEAEASIAAAKLFLTRDG